MLSTVCQVENFPIGTGELMMHSQRVREKKISQWQWQFILDGYDKANLTIVRGKNLIYRPPLHASEGIYVFIREPLLNISALPSSCEITPATYTASP